MLPALRWLKSAAAAEAQEAKLRKDRQWALEHSNESGEALIEYVQKCAEDLERPPLSKEVEGSAYHIERFGSWGTLLTLAGIPLPAGVPPFGGCVKRMPR